MFRHKSILVLTAVLGLAGLLLAACGQATPEAKVPTALAINTASLPDGQVGIIYSQTFKASGGIGQYAWSISSGSLPPGIGLIATTGSINGTPGTAGTFNFTVQVSDGANTATRSLSITVKPSPMPLFIDTSFLAAGEVGIVNTWSLSASGGSSKYAWSISGGALPDGLALDANTGVISGTPKAAGQFNFTVHVDDGAGFSRNQSLNLLIKPLIAISITSFPDGTVGADYYQSLETTGGVGNVNWSISGGSLPEGLTLDSTYGDVSGTPKTAGTFKFTLQAKDILGAIAGKDLSMTIADKKS